MNIKKLNKNKMNEQELERIDKLPLIERVEERLKHNLAVSKEDIEMMIRMIGVLNRTYVGELSKEDYIALSTILKPD